MASSSLENKTVRPGSLGAYSYYHSARRPDQKRARPGYIAASRARLIPWKLVVALMLVAAVAVIPFFNGGGKPTADSARAQASGSSPAPAPQTSAPAAAASTADKTDECAGNSPGKLVLVDISQRHMWACKGGKTVHDAPVVTGMSGHASTTTPTGTYRIYGKQTDATLVGSDVAGSWDRHVYYWMPFLSNQYGIYGFHDATWRSNDKFGNVSPASSDASHGCVEMPLSDQAWLYKWAPVGTTVRIRS